jgi:hypothetical protein
MVQVYTCLISGDEMLSDAFKAKDVVDTEGNVVPGLLEVETKMIAVNDDVDIGCGNEFGGGDDEGPPPDVETVNNLVKAFELQETGFGSVTEFKAWLKDFAGAVLEKLKEQKEAGKIEQEVIKEWRTVEAPAIAKYLLKTYKDLQFFNGPSFNSEALVFAYYPEGAITPNFIYVKKAYKIQKF